MKRPAALLAASVAALVALSGCSVDPAGNAAADLEAELREEFGDHVISVESVKSNTLPFVGELYPRVVLSDSTPPDTLLAVYQALVDYPHPSRVTFVPVGVEANGVGVCVHDEHREASIALRSALHERESRLEGAWSCPASTRDRARYDGDWAALVADTELVQSLGEHASAVVLNASVRDFSLPTGRVTGTVTGPWSQVVGAAEVPAALAAVSDHAHVRSFGLVGDTLTVVVEPTQRVDEAVEAARTAVDAGLQVAVQQGNVAGVDEERFAALAPLADAFRAHPQVRAVTTDVVDLVVATGAAEAVPSLALLWDEHPEVRDSTSITIRVERPRPDGAVGFNTYRRGAASDQELLATFITLLATDGIQSVAVQDDAGPDQGRLILNFEEDRLDLLAQVRDQVPTGVTLVVYGFTDRGSATFVADGDLSPEDISGAAGQTREERQRVADAWNS